jgi:hypothetical protein
MAISIASAPKADRPICLSSSVCIGQFLGDDI